MRRCAPTWRGGPVWRRPRGRSMRRCTRSATTGRRSRRTARRSSTTSPSAVTTSTRAPVRCWPRWACRPTGSTSRWGTCRGGQAARAALAAILLSQQDVLLLDEPTNDLDFAGLDQLERFVAATPAAVVVVSHDRTFLDRWSTTSSSCGCPTTTPWSTPVGGPTSSRRASWLVGSSRRATRSTSPSATGCRQRQQTQREWAVVGVKNAKKKKTDNDKFLPHLKSQRSEKMAAKVKATEKAIERLEVVDKPWEPWQLQLELKAATRGGDVVARLDQAVVELGSFRLGPIDLEVAWQDRLAIVGPNGSGKTTLLRALLGDVDAGERHSLARARASPSACSTSGGCATAATSRCSPAFMATTGLDRSEARVAAGQVRARRRPRRSGRRRPVTGRAHPGAARRADGAGRQLPGARRADQPPRPRGHRAARDRPSTPSTAPSCSSPTTAPSSTRSTSAARSTSVSAAR